MHAIAIHGGAGAVPRATLSAEREQRFRAGLDAALDGGYAVLEQGGTSLDAVATAVRILEDDPLFNAGRGAALTRDGAAELDAAIMDGQQMRAGAVASVRHVKNPVELARHVMEKSRHVLLVGAGAEEFALEEGLRAGAEPATSAPPSAWSSCSSSSAASASRTWCRRAPRARSARWRAMRAGNLAAATSTGGMTNKRPGRVGDSPIIGAGTYAKNGVCAVSATGHGEYFIRAVAAHHVCAAVEYRGIALELAVREMLHEILRGLGGDGGLIGVDHAGRIVMDFSTEGMFRGARDSNGRRDIAIY